MGACGAIEVAPSSGLWAQGVGGLVGHTLAAVGRSGTRMCRPIDRCCPFVLAVGCVCATFACLSLWASAI